MLNFVQQHQLDDFYYIGLEKFPDLVARVCATKPADFGLNSDEERGMPGEKHYTESGWSRKMLGRYFAAGFLCQNAGVLDLCSGLGWGAYILSHFTDNVSCLELNEEIVAKAAGVWQRENMKWHTGNALECDTLFHSGQFSAVTFMESIEHFSCEDGFTMLRKIHSILKDGGILIASSYFPSGREEADLICAKNKHHLYIFTEQEVMAYCKHLFRKTFIANKMLLVAVK